MSQSLKSIEYRELVGWDTLRLTAKANTAGRGVLALYTLFTTFSVGLFN